MQIKKLLTNKYFWYGSILLIIGMFLNTVASTYLRRTYDKIPILNDIILDNLPYIRIQWGYHILIATIVLLFIYYTIKKEFNNIPYFLFLFAIIEYIRAFFIILTPFGTPYLLYGYPYALSIEGLGIGVFPSGHVAVSFLAFLLANGVYRYIILFLTMLMIIILFLGRGHYSVDIFAGVIFAYATYTFGKDYLKERLIWHS